MDFIKEALAKGLPALNEHESKRLIESFGIPVTREVVAADLDSAVVEAVRIGFPVVLKASGSRLFHKSDVEGVALNLRNKEEVGLEGQRLLRIHGCEALLVQEMVKGERELVCGMTRHPEFGPCIMFGLGGILAEVTDDVIFRLAPLTSWEAEEMLQEVRGKRILEAFRGQAPVRLDVVSTILVALGEISLQYEEVHEIDLNPVKIRSDGYPVAVDALVVLKPQKGP